MYTAIITTPHHAFALMNISWTMMPTAASAIPSTRPAS